MANNGACPHTQSSGMHGWWQLPHCAGTDIGGLQPVKQPAWGEVGVMQGKQVCLTPPPNSWTSKLVAMFFPMMPLHKKTASHPSPTSFENKMILENEKIDHFHQSNYSIPMPILHLNPSSPKYPPQLLLPRIHWIARFAVTKFTYRENGGKIPVTEGKPGNYRLPIGKLSLPTGIFGGKGKFEKVNLW